MQFEIHGVLAGGVLEAAGKAGVDGRGFGNWAANAPERNRRSISVDLIKEASVVIRPDIPAHVVESFLRVALSDLTE